MIRDIPKEDWQDFLISFSRLHSNWLVDVDFEEVRLLQTPLEELTIAGSEVHLKAGETTIKIQKPLQIRLQQTEKGEDEALEIAGPQEVCRIRFRSPILPELVDGVP